MTPNIHDTIKVLVIPGDQPHEVRLVVIRDDEHLRQTLDEAITHDGGTDAEELDQRIAELNDDGWTNFYCDPSILLYEVHGLDGLELSDSSTGEKT